MKIIIAGGAGFIGRHLANVLLNAGHQVIVLSRNPDKAKALFNHKIQCLKWIHFDPSAWQDELNSTDVLVNLAGENLGSWPWTKSFKQRILESRIKAGQTITNAVKEVKSKPNLLIQASAVGFYGSRGDDIITEQTGNGRGFVADVCRQWEVSTKDVESMGINRIIIRSGLVLGRDEGLLKKMAIPFKLFIGGPVGSGEQMMPWIHIDDEVGVIKFLLESKPKTGIYNLCTPHPATMNEFAANLAGALNRPSFFRVPEFVVKLVFGEMGRETVLISQNIHPDALIESGYEYTFPHLDEALNNLFY